MKTFNVYRNEICNHQPMPGKTCYCYRLPTMVPLARDCASQSDAPRQERGLHDIGRGGGEHYLLQF